MPENNNSSHWPIRLSLIISWVAIIVAILTAALSLLNYQSLLHRNHDLRISQQTYLNLQTTVNGLNTQMNEQSSQIHQLENQLSYFQNNQTMQLRYSFLEVRHFITLAYMYLTIDHDASTALTLLQTAQSQLTSIQNLQFLPLKNALSSDILKLQKIPSVPVNQLFNQLEKINQTIQALSPVPQYTQKPIHISSQKLNQLSWHERFLEGLKQVKNFIVIRHVDQPSLPLTSPDHLFFLKENIRFKIQMAQWALLHHNSVIFQSSLQSLYDWIKQYFSMQPSAAALLNEIHSLQTTAMIQPLPNINTTWQTLHKMSNFGTEN